MDKPPDFSQPISAALWHMNLLLDILDEIGAFDASVHVSAAIDALKPDEPITEADFRDEEHVKAVLEMYRKLGFTPREE